MGAVHSAVGFIFYFPSIRFLCLLFSSDSPTLCPWNLGSQPRSGMMNWQLPLYASTIVSPRTCSLTPYRGVPLPANPQAWPMASGLSLKKAIASVAGETPQGLMIPSLVRSAGPCESPKTVCVCVCAEVRSLLKLQAAPEVVKGWWVKTGGVPWSSQHGTP